MRVVDICMKNGVMIGPSNMYMPEEFGWFRITFFLGRGIRIRVEASWKSLVEAQAESQG